MKSSSKKTKFIFSIISGIFFFLSCVGILVLGNFNVYILSYIHSSHKWVDIQYGNLISTMITLSSAFISPLAGVLENLIGPRLLISLSGIIIEISLFFLYIQNNLWFTYAITILLGIGFGLSSSIALKNACFFYPKSKGLISSGISSITIFIGAIFLFLGEYIINPEKETVIDEKKNPYYRYEVAERYKYFILLLLIIVPISSFFSVFTFIKYDPSFEAEVNANINNEEKKSIDTKKNTEITESTEPDSTDNENLIPNKIQSSTEEEKKEGNTNEKVLNSKEVMKKALLHRRFWRNIFVICLTPFWLVFVNTIFRAYASLLEVNGGIVSILSGCSALAMGIFGPIWGWLCDKYGFQPIMKILNFIFLGEIVLYIFFITNKMMFVIGLFVNFIGISGLMGCANPHVMQVYGIKYFLIVGGFIKLLNQLIGFLAGIISIVVSIFCKTAEELSLPYRIISIVGLALASIGTYLTFYENDEPFEFNENNKYNENNKE